MSTSSDTALPADFAVARPEAATAPRRAARRRWTPVLVLASCAAAGAGFALIAPSHTAALSAHAPTAHTTAPAADLRLYLHPEPMVFKFNPHHAQTRRQARVSFRFLFEAEHDDVEPPLPSDPTAPTPVSPIRHAIELNWNRAYSRSLEILASETATAHLSAAGKQRIKERLIRELTATLFPDVRAHVREIHWLEYFVQ